MADRKIAVVTGAASGIGQACAVRFAREGYIVAAIDISDRLSETKALLSGS